MITRKRRKTRKKLKRIRKKKENNNSPIMAKQRFFNSSLKLNFSIKKRGNFLATSSDDGYEEKIKKKIKK